MLNHTWDQKIQQLLCHENLISIFSSTDVWVQTSFGIRASDDTHSAHKVKDEPPVVPSSFFTVFGCLLWGPPSSVLTAAQKMDKRLLIFFSITIYDLNGRRKKRVESALIKKRVEIALITGVTSHMKGELSFIYILIPILTLQTNMT